MKPRRAYHSQIVLYALILLVIAILPINLELALLLVAWLVLLSLSREWERSDQIQNKSSLGIFIRYGVLFACFILAMTSFTLAPVILEEFGPDSFLLSIYIGLMLVLSTLFLYLIGRQESKDSEKIRILKRKRASPPPQEPEQSIVCPSCGEIFLIPPTKYIAECTNCGFEFVIETHDWLFSDIEDVSDDNIDD